MNTDRVQGSIYLPPMDPIRRRWARSQRERKASFRLNTLSASRPGTAVEVEEIVFGSVKNYCTELGIHEGTRLVCRGHDDLGNIAAEDERGNEFLLPWDYGLFVWVREV
jgi:hypothetical protein